MSKRKPIEMIKNKYTPLIKMEDELSTLVQFQEKIMAEVIDRQDEEYTNFLVSQITLFMKENNVSTCFILNKEELIDCLKEHNKLHYKIADLQSQLDQANERLNEHNEYFKAFNCKDFKEFQDFISSFMLTPHEEQTLIKDLQNQLNQANERLKGAIVLPVKIGDTIYVVPSETNYRLNIAKGKEEQNKVYEWTVSEIRYNEYGFSVVCDVGDVQFYCNYEPPKNLCGHFDTEKYYGETWFTTRAEAQAKLQELRGGE